jgi:phosphate transport system permease protein
VVGRWKKDVRAKRVQGGQSPVHPNLVDKCCLPWAVLCWCPKRTLSMHLYLVAMETGEFSIAFATAAVLVLLILLLNLGGYYLMQRLIKRLAGGVGG